MNLNCVDETLPKTMRTQNESQLMLQNPSLHSKDTKCISPNISYDSEDSNGLSTYDD
jgi:hypothetical protein